MDKFLSKLKDNIQEALNEEEIIVDSVTFEEKGNYKFLTVVLDKIGGIDLDTIVMATHIISTI